MSEQRPYHHLFGLAWIDFFRDSCIAVDEERDLSRKQQFVDVVLVRQGPGPMPRPLPDGFDNLANHNLITFKSYQEPWTAGRYVNWSATMSTIASRQVRRCKTCCRRQIFASLPFAGATRKTWRGKSC
jgi:hypothetical protein